jgi:hypothetical protein
MPKGKPWTREEEKKLRQLVKSHSDIEKMAAKMGKTTGSVKQKIIRLGLEEEGPPKSSSPSSSKLQLPRQLPSVEQALKTLTAALKALEDSQLSKTDILRLRSLIQGTKIYKELLADYINYRGLEIRLDELTEKYEALTRTENNKSK